MNDGIGLKLENVKINMNQPWISRIEDFTNEEIGDAKKIFHDEEEIIKYCNISRNIKSICGGVIK
jgi:hypothetical protein